MTQEDPYDALKSMVKELEAAANHALNDCVDKGLELEPDVHIRNRLAIPPKWRTAPPSPDVVEQITDAMELINFRLRVLDQLHAYAHGGKLGDIKPVPEGVIRWLRSNGYGHVVLTLDMVCGQ
jgi:hypothetical protein